MKHAVFIEVVREGFAIMEAEEGKAACCRQVVDSATEAWQMAEKLAPEHAQYAVRPDWCKPNSGPGAAFVW